MRYPLPVRFKADFRIGHIGSLSQAGALPNSQPPTPGGTPLSVIVYMWGERGRKPNAKRRTHWKNVRPGRVRLSNCWSDEETQDPLRADDRNFYKVERWTKDGLHITDPLYAGNDLERARKIFTAATKSRPGRPLYHPPTHPRAGQLAGKVEEP